MEKISFEIETITPMFLSGADQSKAELRPASIKGLLRFWWRALQAEKDIKKLKNKEDSIFGSTDSDVGSSKFSIRVRKIFVKVENEYPNPGRYDPVGYHLYSVFMQEDNRRPYIVQGSRFEIILSSSNIEILRIASACLWLLVYLGGVGTRSRRGAGNMVVNNIDDKKSILREIDFKCSFDNSEQGANWLLRNFSSIKGVVNNIKTDFISDYSNLNFARFIISNNSYNTWKDALGAAGYKAFRDRNVSRVLDTASFGLPVIHRRMRVYGIIGKTNISRRSSPLIFKVIRSNGKFYWIVIRLSGKFLPPGGLIKIASTSAKSTTRVPDYSIIDEYWNDLKELGEEYILNMPDTLYDIIERLKEECKPKKIILFGSKARGDFHNSSDVDIAIESETSLSFSSINGAIDLVDLKKANSSIKSKIEKEGVVIYETES